MNVSVRPRRVVRTLALIGGLLVTVSILSQLAQRFLPDFITRDLIAELTHLDGEANLAALFSTLLLLGAGLLLLVTASVKRAARDPFTGAWTALALIMLYLCMDEFAQLHEQLIPLIRRTLNADGMMFFAWVVPYAVLTLAVLVLFLRFLGHLPARIRTLILVSGGLYVLGALGLELFEGRVASAGGQGSPQMLALITLEETLEMFGIILFIGALLEYIRTQLPGLRVRVRLQEGP